MKLQTLLFLTILTYNLTFAQELKNVTKRGVGYKEEFTVLISDKKIKHGVYKRFIGKDQLTSEGNYIENKKVGEWKFYIDGELDHVYDFTTKQLKFTKEKNVLHIVEIDGLLQEKKLDTPPLYVGSKVRLSEELNKVMKYPDQAKRMGVQGIVAASVWINVNGEIEVKLIKGIFTDCDYEFIEGLKKIEKDWIPGTLNNIPIKTQYIVMLEYTLNSATGLASITVI